MTEVYDYIGKQIDRACNEENRVVVRVKKGSSLEKIINWADGFGYKEE